MLKYPFQCFITISRDCMIALQHAWFQAYKAIKRHIQHHTPAFQYKPTPNPNFYWSALDKILISKLAHVKVLEVSVCGFFKK